MSPFVSQHQRAWMYANKPEMAKRWEKETPKGKLPTKLPTKVKTMKKKKMKVSKPGDLINAFKTKKAKSLAKGKAVAISKKGGLRSPASVVKSEQNASHKYV